MAVTAFYGTLTIEAGTVAGDPAETTIHVAPGLLVAFRLYVPPGPRGTVSLLLKHQSRQIAPIPPEVWDHLDDINLAYPLNYPLPVGETDLTLVGYSTYAQFDHSIGFEALVDTSVLELQSPSSGSLLSRLTDALGM